MKPYVVRAGDYLTKLAHQHGFDADEVWGDGKNSDLKKSRKDPNMLQAGDILFVPDTPRKHLKLEKETSNAYVASVPTVTVSVAVEEDGVPVKNAKYVIEGLGDDKERTTDGDGKVTFDAPVHVREVVVRFTEKKFSMKVGIGDLDPIDTDSGARMRLTHLGFYGAKLEGAEQYEAFDDAQLAAAVGAFQQAQKMKATGILDDATKIALLPSHGS